MLRRLQRRDLGLYAEQMRQEILEVRREREQQLRLLLAPECIGLGARRREARTEPRVGAGEQGAEGRVDAGKPIGRIEIGKRQSELKLQHPASPVFLARASHRLQRKRPFATRTRARVRRRPGPRPSCRTADPRHIGTRRIAGDAA
ncbi:MAG TPA: hypothetical protein VJ376_00580 [Pseudomonadota bacterium]|nr:hypothetical protein [Pseudomonadota bacterium]